MRRRPRIDLGGQTTPSETLTNLGSKDDAKLERKRKRWALVNKNRPASENPFLSAIKPDHDNYGDPGETAEELRARLESLEFGNYPGYFNYRNKAATAVTTTNVVPAATNEKACVNQQQAASSSSNPLETGLTDERLRLMKEDWFKNKNVLDVGCNRGHITYAIARSFSPKFILGIDIDLKMIHMANRDLHLHLEEDLIRANLEFRIKRAYKLSDLAEEEADVQTNCDDNVQRVTTTTTTEPQHQQQQQQKDSNVCKKQYTEDEEQHFTLSSYVAQGPLATSVPKSVKTNRVTDESNNKEQPSSGKPESLNDQIRFETKEVAPAAVSECNGFPNNILFVEHNYVLAKDELVDKQEAFFDTIVCLSVTKWIHLNYRDDGLKRFFKRMYNHLNEGGLLILEAQPFDNYHRKKKLSDRLRLNFNSIKFKPDQFDEFLLSDQVGFKQIIYSTTTEHECVGFKRPMKVFLK